jgi:predicted ABC-type ATPase
MPVTESRFTFNLPYTDGIVPEGVVQTWDGQCAPELRASVAADYDKIHLLRFGSALPPEPENRKLYLATAGAPGSGKSYVLEQELQAGSDPRYAAVVKVDPDRYVMLNMDTYAQALKNARDADLTDQKGVIKAYEATRPGSNSIANRFLNEAIATGRHVAHGTTLTTPRAAKLLDSLENREYERHLLLVSAPDDFRQAAVEHRNTVEGFHQVTPDDFLTKGKDATLRTADWLGHTDRASLFWNSDLQQKPNLAATFTPQAGLRVQDTRAYDAYVQDYHEKRDLLQAEGKTVPTWDQCESQFQT